MSPQSNGPIKSFMFYIRIMPKYNDLWFPADVPDTVWEMLRKANGLYHPTPEPAQADPAWAFAAKLRTAHIPQVC